MRSVLRASLDIRVRELTGVVKLRDMTDAETLQLTALLEQVVERVTEERRPVAPVVALRDGMR